jgi:hypothetical protein
MHRLWHMPHVLCHTEYVAVTWHTPTASGFRDQRGTFVAQIVWQKSARNNTNGVHTHGISLSQLASQSLHFSLG